ARHARHFAQNMFGAMHRLQRLRQHHRIELLVVEQRQTVLEVLLDDLDAAPHTGDHMLIVDLDAGAAHRLLVTQIGEQRAIATTQIQNPPAPYDTTDNPLQVRAHALRTSLFYRHQTHAYSPAAIASNPNSRAIRS